MKLLPLTKKLRAYILALRNESTVVYGAPLPRHGNYLGVRSIKGLAIRYGLTLSSHRLSLEVA